MAKINPFSPNSPVTVGMFAGRYKEILELERGLFQTQNNHPNNILITGERGIGKSSLLLYLNYVAKGELEGLQDEKFNFLPINIVVSQDMNLQSFIKLIEKKISRELKHIEKLKSFLTSTWEFVQRIKIFDSEISQAHKDNDIDIIMDEFAWSLSQTVERISKEDLIGKERKDGIIFFIDEADHASEALKIGYFFKTITELLQQNNCFKVMFIVSGLPDIFEKLSSSHESSIRIFTHMKIKELNVEDRLYVVDKGIAKANKENEAQTTITDEAKKQISSLSEGYPHFIQQFAFSAFDHNQDGEIDINDVLDAAFKEGGAIDALGNKYYESSYYDKIKSDDYRKVLAIMAEEMNSWIKKADIRKKFQGDETTLTNALQILTSRKIILKNPSSMGEYRLQQRGFALWIKLFGDRKKR